jgi:hypothetical protein
VLGDLKVRLEEAQMQLRTLVADALTAKRLMLEREAMEAAEAAKPAKPKKKGKQKDAKQPAPVGVAEQDDKALVTVSAPNTGLKPRRPETSEDALSI